MKKSILFLLLCLTSSLPCFACSCLPINTFCETITDDDGTIWENSLIVRAKKVRSNSKGMYLQIKDVLSGSFQAKEIFIEDGNGADCGMASRSFSENNDYIFALGQSYKSEDAYMISICGVSFLPIVNEVVRGAIAPGVEEVPYDGLENLLNCGTLQPFISDFQLFPNPSPGNIRIYGKQYPPGPIHLNIFDTVGRLVATYDILNAQKQFNEIIQMDQLSAGLYFIDIQSGSFHLRKKVVISR